VPSLYRNPRQPFLRCGKGFERNRGFGEGRENLFYPATCHKLRDALSRDFSHLVPEVAKSSPFSAE
jgi:hypothetical protein